MPIRKETRTEEVEVASCCVCGEEHNYNDEAGDFYGTTTCEDCRDTCCEIERFPREAKKPPCAIAVHVQVEIGDARVVHNAVLCAKCYGKRRGEYDDMLKRAGKMIPQYKNGVRV